MTESYTPTTQSSQGHWQLMLATGDIGVWELDIQTGEAWRNRRHDEIFGYRELLPVWTYKMFLDHVVKEDRAEVDRYYSQALTGRRDWTFECRIRRVDGEIRWIRASGRPICRATGEVTQLIGHVLDITDTKRTEEHLRLVTAELNHRVRNMLTMVKALVQISATHTTDVDTFAQAMEDRLGALSRAQDLLQPQKGPAIPVAEIIRTELAIFAGVGERVQMRLQVPIAVDRVAAE